MDNDLNSPYIYSTKISPFLYIPSVTTLVLVDVITSSASGIQSFLITEHNTVYYVSFYTDPPKRGYDEMTDKVAEITFPLVKDQPIEIIF